MVNFPITHGAAAANGIIIKNATPVPSNLLCDIKQATYNREITNIAHLFKEANKLHTTDRDYKHRTPFFKGAKWTKSPKQLNNGRE